MRRVIEIVKRDLRRLLRNPVAMVITVGVCVIPSLYAWYNIAANWDPYGSTAGVRIAVANEDRGVASDLVGSLNVGAQTIEQLKENHDLGWVFTSEREAEEGVLRGDYYASIVIPKDFSEKLAGVLSGQSERPELIYYVNEKRNAIAPKVTDTGAETIEAQINETFVSTMSEALVTGAQSLGDEMDAATTENRETMLGQVANARKSVGQVRATLGDMANTIEMAKAGASDTKQTLGQMADGLPDLRASLGAADGFLTTARAAGREVGTSLSAALSSGATQLGSASTHASAAMGTVTGIVSETKVKVDIGLSNIQAIIDTNKSLIELLRKIDEVGPVAGKLTQLINGLAAQIETMQQVKDGLQAQSDAVSQDAESAAGAVEALDNAVQDGVSAFGTLQQQLNTTALPQLSASLDAFGNVSGDLSGMVSGAAPILAQSEGMADQLNALLNQTKMALGSADKLLKTIDDTLGTLETDIRALGSSSALDDLVKTVGMDAGEVSDFMSSPAVLATKPVYPVSNYGSGVTPFYTNLALWVGGFVLIAIFKLEVDPEGVGTVTPRQAYFGRWLLMVLLGAVQALIVCVGDLALGIQCERPALFVLAGLFTSFVYVNIIYALALAFKHVGKAIGVILVIVQIPGSSGMYPIEMMPAFFRAIHPLLPFTYGIGAMRETIGGMYGMDYLLNLAALGVFLVLALALGVGVRPWLLNLNLLFDRELAATGVMIGEHDGRPRERLSLRAALDALLDTERYRHSVLARGKRFERTYRRRVKTALVLMAGTSVLMFVLASVLKLGIDGKLGLLAAWVLAIIALSAYLIGLEYARATLNSQARMTALANDELRAEIERVQGEEVEA